MSSWYNNVKIQLQKQGDIKPSNKERMFPNIHQKNVSSSDLFLDRQPSFGLIVQNLAMLPRSLNVKRQSSRMPKILKTLHEYTDKENKKEQEDSQKLYQQLLQRNQKISEAIRKYARKNRMNTIC